TGTEGTEVTGTEGTEVTDSHREAEQRRTNGTRVRPAREAGPTDGKSRRTTNLTGCVFVVRRLFPSATRLALPAVGRTRLLRFSVSLCESVVSAPPVPVVFVPSVPVHC